MSKRLIRRKTECWKAFNDDYLISNWGRWYSLKNKKYLVQWPNNNGYMRAQLYIDGKKKWYFTHITVVSKFGDCYGKKIDSIKNLFELNTIDHRDFNKSNNSILNLEIVGHKENCQRRSDYYKKLATSNIDIEEIF